MKDILNRMLNHEELSREETRDIIVGITKSDFLRGTDYSPAHRFADERRNGR